MLCVKGSAVRLPAGSTAVGHSAHSSASCASKHHSKAACSSKVDRHAPYKTVSHVIQGKIQRNCMKLKLGASGENQDAEGREVADLAANPSRQQLS